MSDSINKLDKKYMDLSLEISNEKITRTIEDSKLKAENIKETSLRISNDKKLNNLIFEKYENIMKEIEDLKNKLDGNSKNLEKLENTKDNDKEDENDGSKLLELKKNELIELKNELKYFMNLLDLAMTEESRLKKLEDVDTEKIKNLNVDMEFLKIEIEEIKNKISLREEDIQSIIILRENLILARNKEDLKDIKLKFNNLIKVFNSLNGNIEEDLKQITNLIENCKELLKNIKNNMNFEGFSTQVNELSSKLDKEIQNFDKLYLELKKSNIETNQEYYNINNIDLEKILNLKDLFKLKDFILVNIDNIELKNDEMKTHVKKADNIYLQIKNISISLETLYGKVKRNENNNDTNEETPVKIPSNEINKDYNSASLKKSDKRESSIKKYHIFKRINSSSESIFEIEDEIETSMIPTDMEILNIFKKNNVEQSFFKEDHKIRKMLVQDANLKGMYSKENNKVIGKIVSTNYYLDGLHVKGSGLKSVLVQSNEKSKYNSTFSSITKLKQPFEVFDKGTALELARSTYNLPNAELNVELCYYANRDSEYIIPAYHVSGKHGDINLLETVIPALMEHIPIRPTFSQVEIKDPEILVNKLELSNIGDSDDIKNKLDYQSCIKFKITLNDLKFDKLNIVSVFDTKFDDVDSFDITLPLRVTEEFTKRLNDLKVLLISTNKYGFSNKIKLILDLSSYYDKFEIVRMKNPNHGGNRHNYGIEWAESELGGLIYSRFIKEMNKYGVHKEYSLDSIGSRERHFRDFTNSGEDDYYVDNVDISAYIGHGSGSGFSFETTTNNSSSKLTDVEAKKGESWGNRDLEYQALLSCQVLKEYHDDQTWAQRWGKSFNGLHLLCGFQTNAHVGDNNMLKLFTRNMYHKELTVLSSWLSASLNDQPDDVEAVVMGPLIDSSNKEAYKSIKSTIKSSTGDLYRAHWNDRTWGIKEGPGIDISRQDIRGWWRIVITK